MKDSGSNKFCMALLDGVNGASRHTHGGQARKKHAVQEYWKPPDKGQTESSLQGFLAPQ